MKKLLAILPIFFLWFPSVSHAATTWNSADKSAGITLSGSNLVATVNSATQSAVRGTVGATGTDKKYWEIHITTTDANRDMDNGVAQSGAVLTTNMRDQASAWSYYGNNGNKCNASFLAYGASYTAGDVVMVAVNMNTGSIWFGKNGTWQASGDPVAGTGAAFTNLSGTVYPVFASGVSNNAVTANFGATTFTYTTPTGFTGFDTPPVTIATTSILASILQWFDIN